ncbi:MULTISPECIES: GNAT family N-acetyltransferase [unclassified Nocardioides]|uniref:GNAT family N-acetyltransferase n=1 Tax=unclassified Nocardioides TaxID=2615069 RepID=UPI00301576A6
MSHPVVEVDPHDEAALREWYDVEAASVRHGRSHALHRTFAALAHPVRDPSPFRRVHLLAVRVDGATAGVAELVLDQAENRHLAGLEVHVHPDHRRRGIGRALHDHADAVRRADGRRTVTGELSVAAEDTAAPGLAFAGAFGFATVHREEHLVLPLPADPPRTDPPSGYDVLTWRDRCPDEHLDAYLAMRHRMALDVPTGDLDQAPVRLDAERLRTQERRTARSYRQVVAVARHDDGTMAGYSVVFCAHDDREAIQDDTLVMPAHRGQGLGRQLKLATLDVLAREHPERRALHTWTDPDNHAMRRTNEAFGYRPAELLHQVQRED